MWKEVQQPGVFWRLFTRSAGDDSFVPPGAIEMLSRPLPPSPFPTPHCLVSSFPHSLIPSLPRSLVLPSPPLRESRPARLQPWLASQNAVPPPPSPIILPHSQVARCDVYCISDRSRLPRWVLHMHSACWTASSTFSMKIRKHGSERCTGKDFRFIPGHAAVQHLRRTVVKCCQCWRWPRQASAIDADPR